jgi:hypothetical protein
MNEIIQGLWIGAELSTMERMSVASFLKNGHPYHLYVYDDVKHVPTGTTLKDGNEILPASMIFQYKDFKSYAGFSNFFRYKLLLERGGWWVDTDIVCLRPFDFTDGQVFASELNGAEEVVSSGVIKAPRGSTVMAHAWQVCETKDTSRLVWGETGPRLMGEAVRLFSLERFVKPHGVFCPVSYGDWNKTLEPDAALGFNRETRAVHLWNEMWRRAGQDKNGEYHPRCLYEQLKARYLNQ